MMDLNVVRSVLTLVSLTLFVGLVLWAWSSRRESAFAEAAHLPFDGERNE